MKAFRELQSISGARVPPGELTHMKERAKDKWATDFKMQVYEIKQQIEGYQFCREHTDRRLPADVFATIKSNAAAKWSNDFNMLFSRWRLSTAAL